MVYDYQILMITAQPNDNMRSIHSGEFKRHSQSILPILTSLTSVIGLNAIRLYFRGKLSYDRVNVISLINIYIQNHYRVNIQIINDS